jgi:hypothetical protein
VIEAVIEKIYARKHSMDGNRSFRLTNSAAQETENGR